MKSTVFVFILLTYPSAAVAQRYFSCPGFERAVCLDYGDKVCSSFAKCVDQNSVCFDSYTCNFKGFVCKSTLDDLADEYDDLLRKAKSIASDFDSYRDCVRYASTIDEAQSCH